MMSDNSKIRVLIVDDEPFIRESLTGFLEDCDYVVYSAESAEQAIEMVSKQDFDVAIVDLRLPGMNGDVLIQEISRAKPDIKFLIHTGSVDYRLSRELLSIGVKPEHVFYKPQHDLDCFVNIINELTSK